MPWPNIIMALVWLLKSWFMANNAFAHHWTMKCSWFVSRVSGILEYQWRCRITQWSFAWLSSSKHNTQVVRKVTVILIPCLILVARNMSCTTNWWNTLAFSSGNGSWMSSCQIQISGKMLGWLLSRWYHLEMQLKFAQYAYPCKFAPRFASTSPVR